MDKSKEPEGDEDLEKVGWQHPRTLFGTGLSTCGMLSQKILLQPHPWQCLKLD